MQRVRKEQLYTGLILFIIAGIAGYGISHIYGMSIYPDEFGYWASAASMLGWDWSQIASLGSYYSFGYSLLLFPILKLTVDSVAAYRVAIGLNVVLLCIGFFLLMGIAKKVFPELEKERRIFFAGMAVLYPGWLFYLQTTLSEAMLIFMVIATAYLFVRLLEKPRAITGILLALAAVYTYTLHMRAVGVLIACGITVLLWGITTPGTRKKVLLFLGILLLGFIIALLGKELVQQSVYSGSGKELLGNNDYSGQFNKIKNLLSIPGIRNLGVNMAGKLLYIGFSSAGLAYWGIGWCVLRGKKLIQDLRGRRKIEISCWLGAFTGLMALGQLMICGIYTINSTSPDWIIYGRYIELIVPILIFLGLCELAQNKHLLRGQIVVLSIYTLAAAICLWVCKDMPISRIRGEHSVVTSILIGNGDVLPKIFFGQVWLVGVIVSGMLIGLMWFVRKGKGREWLLILFLSLEILIGIKISYPYVYSASMNMRMDITLVNVLNDKPELAGELLFLREGSDKWVGFLQMQLRERSITVIEPDELNNLSTQGTVMLAYWNSEHLEELREMYKHEIMGDVYNVFY